MVHGFEVLNYSFLAIGIVRDNLNLLEHLIKFVHSLTAQLFYVNLIKNGCILVPALKLVV